MCVCVCGGGGCFLSGFDLIGIDRQTIEPRPSGTPPQTASSVTTLLASTSVIWVLDCFVK